MAILYGFEKTPDGMVRMIASQIEVVQRIYQRYIDMVPAWAPLLTSWRQTKWSHHPAVPNGHAL